MFYSSSFICVIFNVPVNKTHNLNILNIVLQYKILLLLQVMLKNKHELSQLQSLLQETKDISNIHLHNITQCLHLKLSTSFLSVSRHSTSLWIKQNVLEKSTAAIFNVQNNVTTRMQRLIFI